MEKFHGRLKCDTCGHTGEEVELTEALVDTPCPKCGANMLTRGDYESSKLMHDLAMPLLRMLGATPPPADYEGPVLAVNLTHGTVETREVKRDE